MKIIGRDDVRLYTDADSRRMTPGPEPLWQDSAWLQWWDLDQHVGGVHRIGHEYNREGGPFVANWSNLVTPAGIYKKVTYLPLRDADKLTDGWGSGDDTASMRAGDGEFVWTVDDPDAGVSARLVFKDFHGAFMGFPTKGRTAENITAHHIDVAGALTGTIGMNGQAFNVSGLGLRDHGWGHRDFKLLISHRYVTGVFGPDLSFCAFANQSGSDESIETFGWVVRGDTVTFAKEIDILAHMEIDSISTRGGSIRLTLPDDEVIECRLTAVAPGLMNIFHNTFGNLNTLCSAEVGGRLGAGMLESSRTLAHRPTKLARALVNDGTYLGPFEQQLKADDGPYTVNHTT